MRFLSLSVSALVSLAGLPACSKDSPETATYSAGGRDRLCIRNQGDNFPAGVVVYAKGGDANCSISGEYAFVDRKKPVILAKGDACQIEVTGDLDGTLTLGKLHPTCAYYCGPGASLDGKSFTRMPAPEPVTDFAGDPLC